VELDAEDPLKLLDGGSAVGVVDGGHNGRAVACITPESLVAFHTGYDVDATDWADVSALCERFGIPVPDQYVRFR
jgi:hypothetical protein